MKKFVLILSLFLTKVCFGTITVDSVKVLPSSCQKNGSITLYVSTDRPPLIYTIIDGPETRPAQSGNTFAALAKGTYKVLATNFANDSVIKSITIESDYITPDFTFTFTHATCNKDANATITAVATVSTKDPFVWELKNLTRGTTITQNNGNFFNLTNDEYSLRLYDSCQNFVTRFVDLSVYDTDMKDISCSSFVVNSCTKSTLKFLLKTKENQFSNFTGKFSYNGNTYLKNFTHIYYNNLSKYQITTELDGLEYGMEVNLVVYNQCMDSIELTFTIGDYIFYRYFTLEPFECSFVYDLIYGFDNSTQCYMDFLYPLKLELKNLTTNTIVHTDTIEEGAILFPHQQPFISYQAKITDPCGNQFVDQFVWIDAVVLDPVSVELITDGLNTGDVCLDSTKRFGIRTINFLNPHLEVLSTPDFVRSTRPGHSYLGRYNKNGYYQYDNDFYFELGVGNYRFRIFDDCNNEFIYDLTVTPQMLCSFENVYTPKAGCLNRNKLNISNKPLLPSSGLNEDAFYNSNVIIFKNGNFIEDGHIFSSYYTDDTTKFVNLTEGEYSIMLEVQASTKFVELISSNDIQEPYPYFYNYYDTIIIPPYQRPKISYNTVFECGGDIYVNLIPDVNTGVEPYEYEVISGPDLYPLQSSNLFNFKKTGIYTARISDACGNSNTYDFSVDTLKYPPISRIGNTCDGGSVQLFYPSSVYFTYKWTKPNGQVYIGDTLQVNNITSADTGQYVIWRIVNINGCRDSVRLTYRLEQNILVKEQASICSGDAYSFYGQNLTASGTYSHNIQTAGCDSIIELTLNVLNEVPTKIERLICRGTSFTYNNQTYSEEGTYDITLTSSFGCDSTIQLVVEFLNEQLEIEASATEVNQGDSIQLTVNLQGQYDYVEWEPAHLIASPNEFTTTAYVDSSRWYYVTHISKESACTSVDSIYIRLNNDCKEDNVFIPSAFSPNGDGMNDVLRIKTRFTLDEMTLIIFDRYGNKVFETTDQNIGWDGIYKGNKVPQDSYAYFLKAKCDGNMIERKGNITIIGTEK
ncbi:MAG: gliding motility-associated C-terminal domain-containing protein [Chitinophagales bacterium]|nr:gliding motility-associated C-terminal domain-containing protein [Chitinophagales bacterium]